MSHGQASLTFVLRPIQPFRLDLTVWALRRRPPNLIDRWDGTIYPACECDGGRATELAMRQVGSSAAPRPIVTATPPRSNDGSRTPAWCISTSCSTGYRRPTPCDRDPEPASKVFVTETSRASLGSLER